MSLTFVFFEKRIPGVYVSLKGLWYVFNPGSLHFHGYGFLYILKMEVEYMYGNLI